MFLLFKFMFDQLRIYAKKKNEKKSIKRICELQQAHLTAINIHKNTNIAFREFTSISHTCCHL